LQFARSRRIWRLSWLAGARGRRPGPLAFEVWSTRDEAVQEEELPAFDALTPDDNGTAKRALTRYWQPVPGHVHLSHQLDLTLSRLLTLRCRGGTPVSIPLDPAFARINGRPPQFDELAARVEERLA